MSKKKRKVTLDNALEKAKSLLATLSESNTDASPFSRGGKAWMTFSKREVGGVSLSGQEVALYHECLAALSEAVDSNIHSAKAIDKYLKDTIVEVIHEVKDGASALGDLKALLTAKPILKKVYYRVSGFEKTTEPIRFGKIEVTAVDDNHFNALKEAANKRAELHRERYLEMFREFTETPLIGHSVAIVDTEAVDDLASRIQALKELRLTLDIINFYADIFYAVGHAGVSIYGQDTRTWESVPVLIPGEIPEIRHSQQAIGKPQLFNLRTLLYGRGQELGSERISAILTKTQRNAIENRIIASLQWAGRATVDERSEEAFLHYAIALESLVMERENLPELGYRLRMRIAHLLGNDVSDRKLIRSDINHLYDIRSSIVHKGEYIVSDSDLRLLRDLTKAAIMRMLIDDTFSQMESDAALFEWFDEQLLK